MTVAQDLQAFQWQRMPLAGRVLIEASAGTGKTFNIGLVYLRLLLEGEQPLSVERIAVTTFTDAAAQELRERLHARLVEAERLLTSDVDVSDLDVPDLDVPDVDVPDVDVHAAASNNVVPESIDAYLASFRADAQRRSTALRRVQIARADFDRAPITTIHGLCLRVRRDFPLHSGAGFVASMPSDESALLRECVEDFWRSRYLAGSVQAPDAQAVLAQGTQELLRSVTGLFARDARILDADGHAEIERLLSKLGEHESIAELRRIAADTSLFSRTKRALRQRLQELVAALSAHQDIGSILTDKNKAKCFDDGELDGQLSALGQKILRPHVLFQHLRTLRKLLPLRDTFARGSVLAAALAYCRDELPRRARRRDALTFSMLIDEVHERLYAPASDLADVLFDAFPAALIDEFQDTDRRQFAIFDRIYRTNDGRPRGLLVMIGDPKQAIFGFRGGDIAAYLRASAATAQRYSLAINYRSSGALIDALNALYLHADGGFNDPRIQYRAVRAAGNADQEPYTNGGAPVARPLTLHRFRAGMTNPKGGPLTNLNELEALALEDCANRIVELLNDESCAIGARRIVPGDIAVLLTTNRHIAKLRELLSARGVPCVGSGRGSVFDTDTARDLELILYALLNVDDDRAVCGALTTRMLGASYADVIAWQDDAAAFERELERFVAWRELVATRGVLALIEALLDLRGAHWLAQPDGERRITDLRHLGELLAEEQSARHGLDGLYAWFAALRRGDEGEGGDAPEPRQLRVESDLQRVKLLTVHAAKGLEFPLVFLPLAWRTTHRDGQYAPSVLRFHDDVGNECVDVGSAEFCAHRAAHFREDLQERLRLLYVALTRAEHALHVYWVDLGAPPTSDDKAWQIPAIDVLIRRALGGIGQIPCEAALDALAAVSRGIGIAESFSGATVSYQGSQQLEPPRAARAPLPELRIPQWLHSFSSLVRNLQIAAYASPAADETDAPSVIAFDSTQMAADTALLELQGLRGARFGDAVHSILEQAAPGNVWPAQRDMVENALGTQALRSVDSATAAELVGKLVDRVRNAQLAAGLRLIDLPATSRVAEFEFQFPLQRVPVAELRELCARHGHADVVPASLQTDVLNGMLTGFIDLVFAHDGRYHVLDYKTNWLGTRLADYAGAALDAAMHAHQYELQALLYSVAVHRYLSRRLDGYTVKSHLGDSWYLFLRALGLSPAAGIWRRRWPWQLIVELDDAFAGTVQVMA